MGLMLIALLWGFAEATFFFIIPDVILTFIAIHGFQEGLSASLYALAGAMAGGAVIYLWSLNRFSAAYRFVEKVPAIQKKMMTDVKGSLLEKGLFAMILGPIRGIPYKVFAVHAPHTGIGFFMFLLASIPARFIRFFLTSMIAWVLACVLFPDLAMWLKYMVWGTVWIIVYSIYFSIHPWNGDEQ